MITSFRDMTRIRFINIIGGQLLFGLLSLLVVGCSGGGGGDSGGKSNALSRGTGTAIRIIHASIDSVPLQLRVGADTKILQSAKYSTEVFYAKVPSGDNLVVIEGVNAPQSVVFNSTVTLKPKTEYSVFVYGSSEGGAPTASLIEDTVLRPEAGRSLFRVMHGYQGHGAISVEVVGAVSLDPVNFGAASAFVEIPSGPQTVVVRNSKGGELARLTIDALDRGDLSLVVTGATRLGVMFTPVYRDLD